MKPVISAETPALKVTVLKSPALDAPIRSRSFFAIFSELIKIRLTTLVLLTTLVGFYLGSSGPINFRLLFYSLTGTALVACGASALNQLWERSLDAKMLRTRNRPLPAGLLQPDTALLFGVLCTVSGLLMLALQVNWSTCLLGLVTFGIYLFVYTPLKTVTPTNTLVGAIPGALPPLMGWISAKNEFTPAGWALFGILFFWQIPHFLAIAWLYREDYERAGFVMLPSVDRTGFRTSLAAITHTVALLLVSLLPFMLGLNGAIYFSGAIGLGLLFLLAVLSFAKNLTFRHARILFYASIVYLPVLLGLLVLDKINQ